MTASTEKALRRFAKPGEAREHPHHEKPGVERARATPAACKKAQRRERTSD